MFCSLGRVKCKIGQNTHQSCTATFAFGILVSQISLELFGQTGNLMPKSMGAIIRKAQRKGQDFDWKAQVCEDN
jgi:hypothetical protein